MSTNRTSPEATPPPTSPPLLPPGSPPHVKLPKNPFLATVLSLFPGLGQVYNGQPAKAFVFFFAWVGSIYGAASISPFPFAFLIPFVYIYNLIDAYRGASLVNQRFLGGTAEPAEDAAESPAWGGTLVFIGLLLTAHNLGWLDLSRLERFWPVLLIVAGGIFIYGSIRKRKAAGTGDAGQL